MERRITEAQVTKILLEWLEAAGWLVVCYDYPQSGTGTALHLNEGIRTGKNKGVIIPDIVAIKDGTALFFENKDRFAESDFTKLQQIKTSGNYAESIGRLLRNHPFENIYYGVGLPFTPRIKAKVIEPKYKIGFAVFPDPDRSVLVYYERTPIFNKA